MSSDVSRERSGIGTAAKIAIALGVVALIVGAGVAWALVRNVTDYSRTAAVESTKTQMRHIESAIQAYRLTNRELPPTLDAIVGPNGFLDTDEAPTDSWGNEFWYAPGDDGKSYELMSSGADGVEGGEGDDADITRESLPRR